MTPRETHLKRPFSQRISLDSTDGGTEGNLTFYENAFCIKSSCWFGGYARDHSEPLGTIPTGKTLKTDGIYGVPFCVLFHPSLVLAGSYNIWCYPSRPRAFSGNAIRQPSMLYCKCSHITTGTTIIEVAHCDETDCG